MATREFEIACPVCFHEGSQFNDGYTEEGDEKIECFYCHSKYVVVVYPVRYKITRAMRKNAEKVMKE